MSSNALRTIRRPLALAAAITLCAACADSAPVAPSNDGASSTFASSKSARAEAERAIATLRRATARYHNQVAATEDGFVLFHACEVRPGEGGVGELWVNFERLMDGVLDPRFPDALVYEPPRKGHERPKLVAAELAVPYGLWTGEAPPKFLGAEFQREDEYGVYGLHVWIWRHNPAGLFAEGNKRVSCGDE